MTKNDKNVIAGTDRQSNNDMKMKKILCVLTTLAMFAGSLRADEGMWMLPLIQKMNGKAMKELGCKLTPKQIYNINNTSLKDAVVQFGGGCTGEIISDQGLLVTNHHCGYRNIQKLSSVEHDYLKDGFWAMNRAEELPCEGLTVTFLEYMQDITPVLEKTKKKIEKKFRDAEDKEAKIAEAIENAKNKLVEDARKNNPYCDVEIESFYDTNVYYLIVYKTFKDIRFVGAPPSSIGKFGADTDNWMWPRHTGDFSMFRVYADKNNNPAEYSKNNVPYTPKQSLKISLKGINAGDYTMIMGYPGRTTRFQTSPELKFQIEQNDIRIAARTVRQNVLLEDMLADPKIKIQYASKYSGSSNGWKKWQGMKLAFKKLGIIERAEAEEKEFNAWVNDDAKRVNRYGSAVRDIRNCVEAIKEPSLAFTLAYESVYSIELTTFAGRMKATFQRALNEGKDTTTALTSAYEALVPFYKDYSFETDRKVAKAMMKFFRDNAKEENYLKNLPEDFATMDINAFVDEMFDSSSFKSEVTLKNAIQTKGSRIFDELAPKTFSSFSAAVFGPYASVQKADGEVRQARKAYTAGLMEWKKDEPSYPDANFTMRLTYGTVKGYSPKDAVIYRHYTTLDGVMEKEDPDNWEFVVPEKLKQLWKNKDFGQYAMENGKMPVAFLSNNDITGGNSGSPVMNAKGELLGLAFDGNWESMSSDVMFEPALQRCINVDIRYVLFIVDKFGGAGWLLDEMNIVK